TGEDIAKLLQCLKKNNIRKVEGNFYIDAYDFDNEYFAPGTTIDDLGCSWYRPVRGLIIDGKAFTLSTIANVDFCTKTLSESFFDIGHYVKQYCIDNGIEFHGKSEQRKVPNDQCFFTFGVILTPLIAVLHKIMKDSHNHSADCLFKK